MLFFRKIECDLNINNGVGIRNTHLLKYYCLCKFPCCCPNIKSSDTPALCTVAIDRGRMTETGIWFQITGYTEYQAVREKACMNWFIETMTSALKSGYCSFISLTADLEARLH